MGGNRKRLLYGVYENDEIECCVFVGTAQEIAKEFKIHKDAVTDYATKNMLLRYKYKIKKIDYVSEKELFSW